MEILQETLTKNGALAFPVGLAITQEQWDIQAKLVKEAKEKGECLLKALGIVIK